MTLQASASGRVDEPLRINDALTIPVAELSWRFSRSSGPGGQGVNTADSRVELSWNPAASVSFAQLSPELQARFWRQIGRTMVNGQITVAASEHRAQLRNRGAARHRLAVTLATALAPPAQRRRPTRPSRGSVERRLAGKKARSQTKSGRARPVAD